MSKTVVSSLLYISTILLASLLIVTLNSSLHETHLLNEKAIENDNIFINYFQTGNPLEMANIKGITENEVTHMFDVRQLLIIASILTLLLSITLLVLWEKIEELIAVFFSPLLFAWLSIFPLLTTNFTRLFDVFHKILFPQGNYIFSPSSVLISTYPAEFFSTMGCMVGKYFLITSISFLILKIISDKVYIAIHKL